MTSVFPLSIYELARQYEISTPLAFGLGEGLNLYYLRHFDKTPHHELNVFPQGYTYLETTEQKVAARLQMPREEAVKEALVANHYAMMVCTGDPHGLDAIEAWGEDVVSWGMMEEWQESVSAIAAYINDTEGLYRRSYGGFLDEAMEYYPGLGTARMMIAEIADDWLDIAARLRRVEDPADLERLSSRILRMAGRESRFWGMILDYFK